MLLQNGTKVAWASFTNKLPIVLRVKHIHQESFQRPWPSFGASETRYRCLASWLWSE